MSNPAGRPKGAPQTGGKPANKREFTCDACGKTFLEHPSDRVHQKTYCSVECVAQGRRTSEPIPCTNCSKVVVKPPSKTMASGNVFCDRDCYMEWRFGKART